MKEPHWPAEWSFVSSEWFAIAFEGVFSFQGVRFFIFIFIFVYFGPRE